MSEKDLTAGVLADLAQDIKDQCANADPGVVVVAGALLLLAQAQLRTAGAVRMLGSGDAETSGRGAIEDLTAHLGEKTGEIADALRDGLGEIAEAIRAHGAR